MRNASRVDISCSTFSASLESCRSASYSSRSSWSSATVCAGAPAAAGLSSKTWAMVRSVCCGVRGPVAVPYITGHNIAWTSGAEAQSSVDRGRARDGAGPSSECNLGRGRLSEGLRPAVFRQEWSAGAGAARGDDGVVGPVTEIERQSCSPAPRGPATGGATESKVEKKRAFSAGPAQVGRRT